MSATRINTEPVEQTYSYGNTSTNQCDARRYGNIVIVNAVLRAALAERGWNVICTLPAGLRPASSPAPQAPSNRLDGDPTIGIGIVETDGRVRMFAPTAQKGYSAVIPFIVS